jgi:putative aminopeptidase FrvX
MTTWQSRALAVAILLAVMAALAQLVIVPTITAYSSVNEEIAQKTALLERYAGLPARQDRLKAMIEARRQHLEDDPLFLKASRASLTTVKLQEHVRKAIERTDGDIRAIESLPTIEKGNALHQINVRVDVRAAIRDAQEILSYIERGEPVLFVEKVEILANLVHLDDKPRIHRDLRLRMQVSGYWQQP